jgi:UDP-N-acetylglucosamine--N-acetylmuramyl-(pentapeptide) pyrophosphoryl-undecaprenol N-acetylglucosamine transferase
MHYKENGEKKILLIIGGSLGSKIINDLIYENYKILLRDFKIIHVCGKGNLDYEIQKFCKNQENDYEVFETLSHEDLIKLIKISEIVISRAGINSVFELMFFKKLSIFIPLSKKNSRGDQIENAEYFFSKGGCEMIREENLNFLTLLQKLKIFVSKESAHIFRNNLEKIEINLGTDEISEEILNMIS